MTMKRQPVIIYTIYLTIILTGCGGRILQRISNSEKGEIAFAVFVVFVAFAVFVVFVAFSELEVCCHHTISNLFEFGKVA